MLYDYDNNFVLYYKGNYGDIDFVYTEQHIKSDTLPEGLFKYSVRSDDDGKGDPVSVEKKCLGKSFIWFDFACKVRIFRRK